MDKNLTGQFNLKADKVVSVKELFTKNFSEINKELNPFEKLFYYVLLVPAQVSMGAIRAVAEVLADAIYGKDKPTLYVDKRTNKLYMDGQQLMDGAEKTLVHAYPSLRKKLNEAETRAFNACEDHAHLVRTRRLELK